MLCPLGACRRAWFVTMREAELGGRWVLGTLSLGGSGGLQLGLWALQVSSSALRTGDGALVTPRASLIRRQVAVNVLCLIVQTWKRSSGWDCCSDNEEAFSLLFLALS